MSIALMDISSKLLKNKYQKKKLKPYYFNLPAYEVPGKGFYGKSFFIFLTLSPDLIGLGKFRFDISK
ncbi:MAG: hypothetical protein M0R21_02415 [Lentimicrobiaceae bacterium]|nr:hypothetical protein [Lentimicrobiaceae bacterium]